ncbi:hypothetical protein, variant [Phytophthora nicotianae P1569]|uniref:SCP domain-containing protein n=1 Tax=Phytophthora nicotianae P1569 TaxID=1317065 RepID=V9FN21_PHYNI|nr:hypothetical protein, variant [Phytophthora nicotianae P1569]
MIVLRPLFSYLLVLAAVAEAANLRQAQRNLQTYTSSDEYLSAMLARVNQERAAYGLPALCTNKKLQAAAQGHSDDQAANDYMDHTGTDGTSVSERITRSGYDWSAVAENVAAGQPDVDSVMENWMNSPGHRENILGDYTMFGCAYAHNAGTTYQHYWTQDFGTGDAEECDGGNAAVEVQNTVPEEAPVETVVDEPVTTTDDSNAHVQETDAPCTDAPVVDEHETYAPHTDPPVVVYESHETEAPVEETEAPCTTEPPIVVDPRPYESLEVETLVVETYAPHTDPPLPYESHETEAPVVYGEETEAPYTTEPPVVVVDPLPYTPVVDGEEGTEVPCTTEPPVVVVDPLPYTPVVDGEEETEVPCTTEPPVVVVDPRPYDHEEETPIVIVDPPEAFTDPVAEQPEETPVVVVDPPEVTPAPEVYKNYATPTTQSPATDHVEDCDPAF